MYLLPWKTEIRRIPTLSGKCQHSPETIESEWQHSPIHTFGMCWHSPENVIFPFRAFTVTYLYKMQNLCKLNSKTLWYPNVWYCNFILISRLIRRLFSDLSQTNGIVKSRDHIADVDSHAAACYRKAGAIPIGVTNVPEICLWWETANLIHGMTKNPYDNNRTVGGSTGNKGTVTRGQSKLVLQSKFKPFSTDNANWNRNIYDCYSPHWKLPIDYKWTLLLLHIPFPKEIYILFLQIDNFTIPIDKSVHVCLSLVEIN